MADGQQQRDTLSVERHEAELAEFWNDLYPRYESGELTLNEAWSLYRAAQQQREDADSTYHLHCERQRIEHLEERAREADERIPEVPPRERAMMREYARVQRRWAQRGRMKLAVNLRQWSCESRQRPREDRPRRQRVASSPRRAGAPGSKDPSEPELAPGARQ
jgi:hypothetical protein